MADTLAIIQPGSPSKSTQPTRVDDSVVPNTSGVKHSRDGDNSTEVFMNVKIPLAAEDEIDVKRQKRLIRNRVSAQLSRLKKRARMEELEQQVSFLKAQNSELMRQVDILAQQGRSVQTELASVMEENSSLKQHVQMLKDALSLMSFCNKNADAAAVAAAATEGPSSLNSSTNHTRISL